MGTAAPQTSSLVHRSGGRSKMKKPVAKTIHRKKTRPVLETETSEHLSISNISTNLLKERVVAEKRGTWPCQVDGRSSKLTATAAGECVADEERKNSTFPIPRPKIKGTSKIDTTARVNRRLPKRSFMHKKNNRGVHNEKSNEASLAGDNYRSSRLFVRGVPPFMSAAQLKEKFSSVGGEVTDVCLLLTETGRSRQCAFVGFKTQAQAVMAKEYFDGAFFYTRKIAIEYALPKHSTVSNNDNNIAAVASPSWSSAQSNSEKKQKVAGASTAKKATVLAAAGGGRGARVKEEEECSTQILTGVSGSGLRQRQEVSALGAAIRREDIHSKSNSVIKQNSDEWNQHPPEQRKQHHDRYYSGGGCGAQSIVVEESTVHARKAGVGSVRRRLIFEDLFSTSEEEKGNDESDSDEKGPQCDKGGGKEVSDNSGNSSASHRIHKKKRRKNGEIVQLPEEERHDTSGVTLTNNITRKSFGALGSERGEGNVGSSSDIADVGAISAVETARPADATAAGAASAECNEGKSASDNMTRNDEDNNSDDSQDPEIFETVDDDLLWLRQTSAAHAAAAAAVAAAATAKGDSGATTRVEGANSFSTEATKGDEESSTDRQEATGEKTTKPCKGKSRGKGRTAGGRCSDLAASADAESGSNNAKKTIQSAAGAAVAGAVAGESSSAAATVETVVVAASDNGLHNEKKEDNEKGNSEEGLTLLGVHGRLLVRNFPFATTKEELQALCEHYGEIAEVHIVYDEETQKSKGYAFVTYVFPEHAVVALTKLDGMIFQGRLLEVVAAKPDEKKELRQQQREQLERNRSSSSSYKRKKQQNLLQQHIENEAFMEKKVWNLLYVSANSAVDAVAREFDIDKTEFLGLEKHADKKRKTSDLSAAARVALAETHLLQATREWIIKEGISPTAFERCGPTLLSATTTSTTSSSMFPSTSTDIKKKRSRSSDNNADEGDNKGDTKSVEENSLVASRQQHLKELDANNKEENRNGMTRSRDTLIVKHLPTAHVVGAELLRMFESVGAVVRFLLAPSKTVAIVQYEKEKDAATAFKRLAYRKYKTVPLFIEKAPVDIFIEEEEQRRQAIIEATAEANAASHANILEKQNTTQKGSKHVSRDTAASTAATAAGRTCSVVGGEQDVVVEHDRPHWEKKVVDERRELSSERKMDGSSSTKKKTKEFEARRDQTRNPTGGDASEFHTGASAGIVAAGAPARSDQPETAKATEDVEHVDCWSYADEISENTLFVKNVNFRTTETALYEVFAGCTGLRTVKLMTKKKPVTRDGGGDRDSKSTTAKPELSAEITLSLGYAFVEFDSAANATAACKRMQGIVVDGHTLNISMSRSRNVRRTRGTSACPLHKNGAGLTEEARAGGWGGALKSRKLLVRNLAFQATAADLRGLFSAYGNVTRVCIPTQHEGRSRGFGFVDFATRPEAAAALQALSATHLYGRKLVLEMAVQDVQGGSK